MIAEPTDSPPAPVPLPLSALEEGLAAFSLRDLETAHACFERAHRREPRAPRPLSWYGMTLVLVERNSSLGVSLCEQALRTGGPGDPELLLNLARAHVALRQRERAARALSRGLESNPAHPAILAALEALGNRRRPVLPFLDRSNPLNRLLGRIRHAWSHRGGPDYDLSPEALGSPPRVAGAPRS